MFVCLFPEGGAKGWAVVVYPCIFKLRKAKIDLNDDYLVKDNLCVKFSHRSDNVVDISINYMVTLVDVLVKIARIITPRALPCSRTAVC